MATFFVCTNNGVTVVVPKWVVEEDDRRRRSEADARHLAGQELRLPRATPRFTFSDNPHARPYVTGTTNDMRVVLEGHGVVQSNAYVPFSNGIEYGSFGEETQKEELEYRTTLGEAITAFGLRPHPELAHGSEGQSDPASRIQWHNRVSIRPLHSRTPGLAR